jgi:diguanylate cyclase (GGDEF)-like protein
MPASPAPSKPAQPLSRVIGHGERVQDLVEEAADDLSSVNTALTTELASTPTGGAADQAVKGALAMSVAVEEKVQAAVTEVADLNVAVQDEVRERGTLEQRLDEVTAKGEADRHASLHDVLTGLPNRALFHDRLEHGLAQAGRHGWTLAVMFVDLDDFKQVNDRHGHHAGDALLRIIADRLRASTRSDDTISRRGGDEFLYLLLEIKREEDVVEIATKLAGVVQAPCEVPVAGVMTSVRVGASIGIALYPRDGTTADALIAVADKAMYQAKQRKSGYAFASAAGAKAADRGTP